MSSDKARSVEQRINNGLVNFPLGAQLTSGSFASVAAIAGMGILSADAGGYLLGTPDSTSSDSDYLNVGHKLRYTTGTQTVNSTTQTQLGTLGVHVGTGTWMFLTLSQFNGLAANQGYFSMAGTATVSDFAQNGQYFGGISTTVHGTTFGNNTAMASGTLAASTGYASLVWGYLTVTAAGTLVVNVAASANANTMTVTKGSIFLVSRT